MLIPIAMCAVQPLEQDMVSLAQQQICLQKMELFYDSWWVPLAYPIEPLSCALWPSPSPTIRSPTVDTSWMFINIYVHDVEQSTME